MSYGISIQTQDEEICVVDRISDNKYVWKLVRGGFVTYEGHAPTFISAMRRAEIVWKSGRTKN